MNQVPTPTTPWPQNDKEQVARALMDALMLMGQELTDQQFTMMLDRLYQYPVDHVISSLRQCEKRCRRIFLVDIIDNLPRKQPLLN